MKITIIQGAFLPVPPLRGGAVEKMWHLLARKFASLGHEVVHLSRAYPGLPDRQTEDGVRQVRVGGFDMPASLWKLKFLDLIYSRRCARVLEPADIIVTHTFWLPMFPGFCRKGAVYADVQRMPRGQMRFYHRAARLRANSQAVARAIRAEAPGLADRVAVIPNPLPFPPLSGDRVRPLADRPRVLLFVGRVHPEKGLHVLIEAFQRIDPDLRGSWKVCAVGPWNTAEGGGGEGYVRQLKQMANDLPVEFTGPVHDPLRLAGHYESAPIFVYPSLAAGGETFGMAPLEAMAHGCVPVVSGLECFRDFIEPGVNGATFDQSGADPAGDLAAELDGLMRAPARCAVLSARAMEVNRTHAPDRIAELFLADFEKLAGPGVAGAARARS